MHRRALVSLGLLGVAVFGCSRAIEKTQSSEKRSVEVAAQETPKADAGFNLVSLRDSTCFSQGTNTSSCLQGWVNANGGGGKTLTLGVNETYQLTAPLNIPASTVLDGGNAYLYAGSSWAAAEWSPMIRFSGGSITLKNIRLQVLNEARRQVIGVSFGPNAAYGTIDGVKFWGGNWYLMKMGVLIDQPGLHDIVIKNSEFYRTGYGILFNHGASKYYNSLVEYNSFNDLWLGDAIAVNCPQFSSYTTARCSGYSTGHTFRYNVINNVRSNVLAFGFGISMAGASGNIYNNDITNVEHHGIHIEDASFNVDIKKNKVSTTYDAFGLWGGEAAAIWVGGANTIWIHENQIRNAAGSGISLRPMAEISGGGCFSIGIYDNVSTISGIGRYSNGTGDVSNNHRYAAEKSDLCTGVTFTNNTVSGNWLGIKSK